MSRLMDIARNFQFDPSMVPDGRHEGEGAYDINDINDKRVITDPYQKLAVACLAKICRPDYPAGMIPWLGEKHPTLYDELTARLPDEIHRLWVERAPLDEFERILGLWLEAHRTSCELHRKSRATVPQ